MVLCVEVFFKWKLVGRLVTFMKWNVFDSHNIIWKCTLLHIFGCCCFNDKHIVLEIVFAEKSIWRLFINNQLFTYLLNKVLN